MISSGPLLSTTAPSGQARETGISFFNVHIMTPETERTTHYFFASTRDFAVEDGTLNDQIATARGSIFASEDEPMIEAQQNRIGDASFWDLAPVLMRIDDAPVRARRQLDKLIAREAAEESARGLVHER